MSPRQPDPKQVAALLREARTILRRLDKLAAAPGSDGPSTSQLIGEAQASMERLVKSLGRQEAIRQRHARPSSRTGASKQAG